MTTTRRRPTTAAAGLGGVRRQLVVLAAAVSGFAAVVLVMVLYVVLEQAAASAANRVAEDRLEAVTSAIIASSTGPDVLVPDRLLDPGVVVYATGPVGRLTRVSGAESAALRPVFLRQATAAAARPRTLQAADVDDYRVAARGFTTDAGREGVVVVAEPLQPYERGEGLALLVYLAIGLVVVGVATLLAAYAGGRALAPVADMARTAREWSDRDLDRRFDLGPPTDEIRSLGDTLDALLERVAQAIRSEQRLTAELAHELRTPLTALQATAELASSRDDLDDELREDLADITAAARRLAGIVAVLLDVARTGGTSPVTLAPEADAALERVLTEALAASVVGASVEVDAPPGLVVDVPPAVVVRALAPVLANADRHGRRIRVSARAEGRRVHVCVEDDGSGVAPGEEQTLFVPGRSGVGGSGLGLSLARRVARAAGGEVALVPTHDRRPGSLPGAHVVVTVPGHDAAGPSTGHGA